jgi:hypothetical protein
MTSEELWEKKEMIGAGLVILLFFSGLLFFKLAGEPGQIAIGTLNQVRAVGYNSKAYDILVTDDNLKYLYRERITHPTAGVKAILEKNPGDYFEVKYEILENGSYATTFIGKTIPQPVID